MRSLQLRFTDIFNSELVVAERKKATILAMLLAALAIVTLIVGFLRASEIEGFTSRSHLRFLVPVVLAGAGLYQWLLSKYLNRITSHRRTLPGSVAYLNAIVEVCIPSLLMFVVMQIMSPLEALNSPTLALYFIFIAIGALHLNLKISILTGLLAAVQYIGLYLVFGRSASAIVQNSLFNTHALYIARGVFLFLTGIATGLVAREIRRRLIHSVEVIAEQDRIVSIFGRYLTDDIAEVLLKSPEGLVLGGEKRQVTMMMTDLRGFSNLSESMDPEDVVRMLNNYLAEMTDVIAKYRGTIDEFIGDAIFVIFGAPVAQEDNADRAIACAIEMQQRMNAVNAWNRQHGFQLIEMGIGINSGEVVVGNIGSEKRSKYGAVGSQVNITARIESYTVGGQILISDNTRDAAKCPLEIGTETEIEPKGVKKHLRISEVLGIGPPYEITTPWIQSHLQELTDPLPVQLKILKGKDAGGSFFGAMIVSASRTEAELECEAELTVFDNVLLKPDGFGDMVYGKIISLNPIRIRYTSIAPGFEAFLLQYLST